MKPIQPQDRKIANIRTAEFMPWDSEGESERGTSILQLNIEQPKGVGFYIYKMEPGARSAPLGIPRREGFKMCDVIKTVFERFEIVWPPDVAAKTKAWSEQ